MSNHHNWNVKRLTGHDVALMRELQACFGRAFDDMPTYTDQPPADAYYARLLNKPEFITLVVLSDTRVVGGLVAYQLEKFEQQRSEIYIYDLAVDEQLRRRGIAASLIECLKTTGNQLGAYEVFVQADYGDEPAIALYTSLGVREDVMHFSIPIRC